MVSLTIQKFRKYAILQHAVITAILGATFLIMPKAYDCCWCHQRSCGGSESRRHVRTQPLIKETERRLGRAVLKEDVVCHKCYQSFSRKRTVVGASNTCTLTCSDPEYFPPLPTCNSDSNPLLKSPKSICLPITSTPKGHRKCVICRKPYSNRNRLINIPASSIVQAFVETGIFINDDSRCCKMHVEDGYLNKDALSGLTTTKDEEQLSRTDICKLLSSLRSTIKSATYLNFDVPSLLSEEDYLCLTGLRKEQFAELVHELKNIRNNSSRTKRTCLAVFLTKLRTGLPNTILSTIFKLSVYQIQRIIPSVREALMQNFVPKHLGFQHISHQEFSQHHTTPIARKLFTTEEDQAVIILDGTYIYIQKSYDYEFQRLSYSLHKNRPLVKPMMVVASDGYILSVMGPYVADCHNNDASITKHMYSQNAENIQVWLKEDDVVVVDRGFRDAVTFMEDIGLKVHMPFYLQRGEKQHTTTEANLSRMVTKVRWVVESANGRLKQWRLLDKVIPNKLLPQVGDFVRIVCALCNCFRPCLGSMDPETESVAIKMLERSQESNEVQVLVQENKLLTRCAVYSAIDASSELADFPVLSLDDLRSLTLGIYQVKHAENYTREHLKDEGSYEVMVCHDFPNLLRVKIQSRHSRNVLHTLWIKYRGREESVEAICGWYCTCKIGARLVGCCAHVSSVLWFLGWKRHQSEEPLSSGPGPKCHFLNAAYQEDSDSDIVEE
ncbi:uncharacterized protein LOC134269743 [Saccostrea cucullata]|uniref:uncharacterized protein LOC134269743 n=1 Tax=Saccostrea cuccullata TaxID=36930 RepID=UPI002ED41F9E